MKLHDSGRRRVFKTGAVRDSADVRFKGRFDLIAVAGVLGQALQMQRGALKYSARNWEKGMPLSVYLNSCIGHILAHAQGFDDEPHMDAALWNLSTLAETDLRIQMGILPKELDDLPHTFKGKGWQEYLALARGAFDESKGKKHKVSVSNMRRKKK